MKIVVAMRKKAITLVATKKAIRKDTIQKCHNTLLTGWFMHLGKEAFQSVSFSW